MFHFKLIRESTVYLEDCYFSRGSAKSANFWRKKHSMERWVCESLKVARANMNVSLCFVCANWITLAHKIFKVSSMAVWFAFLFLFLPIWVRARWTFCEAAFYRAPHDVLSRTHFWWHWKSVMGFPLGTHKHIIARCAVNEWHLKIADFSRVLFVCDERRWLAQRMNGSLADAQEENYYT